MNNISKILILSFCLAVLALFAYNSIGAKGSVNKQQSVSSDFVNQQSSNTAVPDFSIEYVKASDLSVKNPQRHAMNLFAASKTAGNAEQIINLLIAEGNDGLAYSMLLTLSGRCEQIDGWLEPHKNTAWAYRNVLDYCDDYNPDHFSMMSEQIDRSQLIIPNFSALISDQEKTDINEVSEEFLTMLAAAEFPSGVLEANASNAIRYFSQDLGVPLQLGQDLDRINPLDAALVQNSAIDIYMCTRFSNCSADEFLSLGLCAISNQCLSGWSMIDYYQNTLSPINFEQVMNIVYEIRKYERPANSG